MQAAAKAAAAAEAASAARALQEEACSTYTHDAVAAAVDSQAHTSAEPRNLRRKSTVAVSLCPSSHQGHPGIAYMSHINTTLSPTQRRATDSMSRIAARSMLDRGVARVAVGHQWHARPHTHLRPPSASCCGVLVPGVCPLFIFRTSCDCGACRVRALTLERRWLSLKKHLSQAALAVPAEQTHPHWTPLTPAGREEVISAPHAPQQHACIQEWCSFPSNGFLME